MTESEAETETESETETETEAETDTRTDGRTGRETDRHTDFFGQTLSYIPSTSVLLLALDWRARAQAGGSPQSVRPCSAVPPLGFAPHAGSPRHP